MKEPLDLRDIQGNIIRAYGRYGFPHARYLLFHFDDAAAGRDLVLALTPLVTTSERWKGPLGGGTVERPKVTLNIAFSWKGLAALDLPTQTLSGLPEEFIQGMPQRASLLSDFGASAPHKWDPVWRRAAEGHDEDQIHMLVILNAQMQTDGTPVPELEEMTETLRSLGNSPGLRLLTGHNQEGAEIDYQQAGAKLVTMPDGSVQTDAREHFGYEDGIGNPVFEGQYPDEVEDRRVKGRGKIMPDQTWLPLATGEFIIGHVDESQELPYSTRPPQFLHNGTFLAFRKLHENVGTFNNYIGKQAGFYAAHNQISETEASETIRAKMVGRWPNGVPLMEAPTYADLQRFNAEWSDIPAIRAKTGQRTREEAERLTAYQDLLINFKYRDDQTGTKCPISAHIRRGNMRDMLDPLMNSKRPRDWDGSALTNRRRILRRGLPYGPFDSDPDSDSVERGVIFIAMCANIFRQFEFVLQQWINYGLDLNAGNDNCPLLGHHDEKTSKFIIQTDPNSGKAPWIMNSMPQFVDTRGGEYFFVPSLNTLKMIGLGVVDPT